MNVPPKALSLDAPWAMGEEGFACVADILEDAGVRHVLEFGSGVSTIRLALVDDRIRVTTIDHEAKFLDRVRANAELYGVSDRVRTVHAPLRWYRRGLAWYCTYDLSVVDSAMPSFSNESSSMVLIDGPPSWTGGGRAGLLEELVIRDFYGATLALVDDASRGLERFAVEQLRTRGADGAVSIQASGHGIGILLPQIARWGEQSMLAQLRLTLAAGLALCKQGARRLIKGARHP